MKMLEDLSGFWFLHSSGVSGLCVCVVSIHYGQPTCSECLVWNFKSTTIICFKSATSNQHQLTSNQHQLTNQSFFVLSQTVKKNSGKTAVLHLTLGCFAGCWQVSHCPKSVSMWIRTCPPWCLSLDQPILQSWWSLAMWWPEMVVNLAEQKHWGNLYSRPYIKKNQMRESLVILYIYRYKQIYSCSMFICFISVFVCCDHMMRICL